MPSSCQSPENLFAAMTQDDEILLVSLPYRIGLYVSFADVTGGWEAQEREQQSLANILRQYSEDFCKNAFCQGLLMETLIRRSEWALWAQNIDTVPEQAAKAVMLISSQLSEKELKGFKEVLVDIAIAVAMAFHEEGKTLSQENKIEKQGVMAGILSKIKAGTKPRQTFSHVHISQSERAALSRVCDAMDLKDKG